MEAQASPHKRSRRLYVYWGAALGLLLLLVIAFFLTPLGRMHYYSWCANLNMSRKYPVRQKKLALMLLERKTDLQRARYFLGKHYEENLESDGTLSFSYLYWEVHRAEGGRREYGLQVRFKEDRLVSVYVLIAGQDKLVPVRLEARD